MLFAQIEKLTPNQPALPKMPDLSGAHEALTKLQAAIDSLGGHVSHVNSGLLITGIWIGAVSMAVIWFCVERYRGR